MKKTLATILLAVFALLWGGFAQAETETYLVKKGDTLWRIAKENFGDPMLYNVLYSLNIEKMLKGPDHIYPGQILEMPERISVAEKEISRIEVAKESAPKTANKVVAITKTAKKKAVKAPNKTEKKVVAEFSVVSASPEWKEPGGNKYCGGFDKGLVVLDYSIESQSVLAEKVDSNKFDQFATISHIAKGGIVVADDGSKYRMVKMLSGGCNGSPIKVLEGPEGVIPNWTDNGKLEAGKIYSSGNEFLLVPLKCGNPTLVVKLEDAPPVAGLPVVEPPVTQMPPGLDLIIPPLRKKEGKEKYDKDSWDWYIGAGNYQSRIDPGDNHGYYGWTKFRYRPWWMDLDENQLGIKGVGLGFFGFLAGGKGIAAEHYRYNWHEGVIGATAKTYGNNWDSDLDIGWGKLWNEGSWMGVEDRDQVDYILLISAHGNFYREGNPDWFPKREVNLEYRHILSSDVRKGGTAVNNEVLEISLTQWIYKFHLGEGDSFNVSPGINLGLGYEKSSEDEEFFKTGPAFEFTSYKHVVGAVSLFNYKFQGDGQWHPISFYLSPDGISRAYDASRITAPTAEDLGEENQQLLKNPADYL